MMVEQTKHSFRMAALLALLPAVFLIAPVDADEAAAPATESSVTAPPYPGDMMDKRDLSAESAMQAVQDLQRYIQIPTINPPGATTDAVAFLAERFAAFGVSAETLDGADPLKPTIMAKIEGKDPSKAIILLHHMDVVPAIAKNWKYPPYEGLIAEGAIWGRGTFDTKSLGIIQLAAMRTLAREGVQPQHSIIYVGVPDEETQGAAGAGWFAEQILPTLPEIVAVLNEGAVGSIGVLGDGAISMLVQVAEKQPLWLKAVAHGTSGHGSAPHDDNAADKIIRAVRRFQDHDLRAAIMPPVAETLIRTSVLESGITAFAMRHATSWPFEGIVLSSMEGKSPQARAMTRNACSLTGLEAGIKTNVIPSTASATFDCRLLPDQDFDEFKAEMLGVFDEPDIELEIILQSPSGPTSDFHTPIFAAMEKATLAVYPDAIVSPYMSAGYTDSAFFRQRGLTAYGFNPLVLTKEEVGGLHNDNERIGLESYKKAVKIYTDFLRAWAKGE